MDSTLSDPAARARVGRSYRCAKPFSVERARIKEFARAVRAFHPAHWHETAAARLGFDAIVAPPTFAAVVWKQMRREILETLITGYDLDRIVHVDQTLDIGRPLLAGDVLTCDVHFESFRHFDPFDVITMTGVLTDQDGTLVQSGSMALLAHTRDPGHPPARPPTAPYAGIDSAHLPCRPARRHEMACTEVDFDRLATGAEVPPRTVTIAAQDLTWYTQPMDGPRSERIIGAGGVPAITPGALALALAAEYVTSWTDDPTSITKYRAEFANQVHYLAVPRTRDAEIEFRGRIIACDRRRRTATVSIDAKSQGRKIFGYASADVRFGPHVSR
ncbi:hypothetical protein GFY24_14140 [Nocardia sp. SYP-A9097]|uniref:FAS1-like dehydratase domain-containing protein n=1 Tax=Nocardia sp. SYP-A9097 TaxID=2663237 RepID=UPI00129B0F64|nr:MaoC family dehydratase N-terminal domain-containing protein [Nocardia sp. SYP-A9097]MRH88572.1 hypothetical protein [Nocardia sp. SYP-A9097]